MIVSRQISVSSVSWSPKQDRAFDSNELSDVCRHLYTEFVENFRAGRRCPTAQTFRAPQGGLLTRERSIRIESRRENQPTKGTPRRQRIAQKVAKIAARRRI